MKLFCFLISFVIANVSTYDLAEYKKYTAITNAHIVLANNLNDCYVGDNLIANGLEHVIKKIVNSNNYSLDTMNRMIAVPEQAYIGIMNVSIAIQISMQEEIKRELIIADFTNLTLTELAERRRRLTENALKNILRRALDFDNLENLATLIEGRRFVYTESLKNKIMRVLNRREQHIPFLPMCCFMALFMSTKFPTSFIRVIEIGSYDTCVLKEKKTSYKSYREIDGVWWQIIINGSGDSDREVLREQTLREQLQ
ncbi:uncharacterized protein LOC126836184 isoform X2 [Adelges cooleyi]|uniref:uncharacterized protein LOC126836184 isoform X2 n=1 Tax=Adelges cooleyi TaxID=133065 RepID=UPI00217F9C34|nr:uncharacterized protein LOC126836184 isoform X2 [Adelges cooleyi]